MNINTLYVISCPLPDEKKLVKAIESAFDCKLSLSKNADLLNGYRPQVLDHIWFKWWRANGLFIELRHNRDTEGRLELPDYANHPLILFTRVNHSSVEGSADPREVQSYAASCVSRLVSGLPYEVLLVDHSEESSSY